MHIALITDRAGFPHGFATAPRIKLYVRSLKNAGISCHILITRYSELKGTPLNTEIKGNYAGVPFEYTTTSTIRPNHFIKRRQSELQGIWNAFRRLVNMKKNKNLNCMYYYGDILYPYPDQYFYSFIAKLLHVPFVIELCECPWSLLSKYKNPLNISPLWGVNGVVSISKFLSDWVFEEKRLRKYHLENLEIPILADVDEQVPTPFPWNSHSVLFAASSGHIRSMFFITDAMENVWKEIPDSKLLVTGILPSDINDMSFKRRYESLQVKNKMEICGYLPREIFLNKFGEMGALLIPLFNDSHSKARFPTKIGEYLLSERPIVTTNIGEIPRFFTDQKNAFIALPDDPQKFGEKIIYALKNKDISKEVGIEGRKVVYQHFDYRLYSEKFKTFFETVVKNYR